SYSTFTANVVTCLKLTGVTIPRQFETWHRNGMKLASDSGSIKLPQSILHILGNNMLYPIAIYASLKMAEFFGVTATAKKIDNLSGQLNYFEFKNPNILSQLFQSIFFLQSFMLLLSKKYNLKELKYRHMKKVLKISSDIIYNRTYKV